MVTSSHVLEVSKCAENVYTCTVLHWILLVVSLVMSMSLFILRGVYVLPQAKANQEAVADIQVKVQTLMNTVARIDCCSPMSVTNIIVMVEQI